MPKTPTSTEQDSHFWFMSVMTVNAAGPWVNDYQGTLTLILGTTRLEVFNQIREEVAQNDPRSRGSIVLAFDVQPNEL
ncbi:hypothetical protein ABT150_23630 [Streptomyces mirabilis]|uniref:hypothetical protein n=1 Tax=Streptomyces mirabilis TaxID=68239 RepID=UPI00331ADFF0